jgi:NAD-dependent dihydropyrimidine dehydrogenase PreA subunit
MIALILEDRCDGCNACADACPTDVFDTTATIPTIARIDACQTCYMCELYCARDAIYVAPGQFARETVDREAVVASGELGRIRRDHGWDRPGVTGHLDQYRLLGPLLNEGAETAVWRYRDPAAAPAGAPKP